MSLILRVDDVGWVPPNKENDAGLKYFQSWRNALRTHDLPVYLGLIPTTVTDRELQWFKQNLNANEELAVHGWDHEPRTEVTREQMLMAKRTLSAVAKCRSYIPPFNAYGDHTIADWSETRQRPNEVLTFFGGFRHEHYRGPAYPFSYCNVNVLPAPRFLYDKVPQLLENVPQWLDLQCPLVVTLHATWDQHYFKLLSDLHDLIKPHMGSIDDIPAYLDKIRLTPSELTGAHYRAYSYIAEHINPADMVMDFGARYSVLPAQMALRGARVLAVDRDPIFFSKQEAISKKFGINPPAMQQWDGLTPFPADKKLHVITSCWAIQHNLGENEIETIARNLSDMLVPNGKMLIVSSFSPDQTFEQLERQDPQIVLNQADIVKRVVEPSGCTLEEMRFFKYTHAKPESYECQPMDANAVFYVLRKPA